MSDQALVEDLFGDSAQFADRVRAIAVEITWGADGWEPAMLRGISRGEMAYLEGRGKALAVD